MEEVVDTEKEIVTCAWFDNRQVMTVSNFAGVDPTNECKRFDRKKKEIVTVPQPHVVAIYNRFMGGVDKANILLALYKTKCKTSKWYQRIAFHLFRLAVINAWIIYREIGGGQLLPFLQSIAVSLIKGDNFSVVEDEGPNDVTKEPVRSLKRKHVPSDVRHDGYNHWPIQVQGCAQRCKAEECKRKTRFYCSKCQVYLHDRFNLFY